MKETDLILQILKEQKENNEIQIKAIQKNMDAGFDLLAEEMRKITEQKIIQNGRVDKLENITGINRFIYKNPKMSILLGIGAWYLVSQLFSIISLSDLIKKII